MSYKPLDAKITPGGLNLLAPGDAVADGDCLDLTGWWPGAVGKLEQAPTATNLSAAHLTFFFDAICQAAARTYFGGAGSLFQVGRAAEAAIDSGFDTTYPLAMIAYQNYVWIMNATKARKDDGSTVTDWVPAPPAQPTLNINAVSVTGLAIQEADPADADSTGKFTTIRIWTLASIAGMEVGGLGTITGLTLGGSAMNGTWLIKAIYPGSGTLGSLIEMQATVASTAVYRTGEGSFAYSNPSMPLGSHNYWVTWVFTDLGESNPSSVAGVVTATAANITAQGYQVHVIAPVIHGSAVAWNVYRQSPGSASPYRVNPEPIPIATAAYDDYGDAAHNQDQDYLENALGIIMEGDHGPPPPARVVANQIYNGRIVVANSVANPNRIWYTPPLQPAFFRGALNSLSGDWVDVGTDRGDEIQAITVRPQMLTIYRQKTIWRLVYDFKDANSRCEVVVPDMGIVGPRAVASTSMGDYIRCQEGVYRYNNDWCQKFSAKLDPIFKGTNGPLFLGEAKTYRKNCALGMRGGRLWVSYTWNGQTQNTSSVIWHQESDRWFANNASVGAFLDTTSSLLAAGLYYVSSLESAYSNDPVRYQSAFLDGGLPDHEKTWADLVVSANTQSVALDVWVQLNKGAEYFKLDTPVNTGSLTKTVVPLLYPASYGTVAMRGTSIKSHNLSIIFAGSGKVSGPAISIETPLIVHYFLEARKGLIWDTDEMDHGLPGVVKSVDEVEFDIDSTGGAGTLQIYSDVPGGDMAARLGAGVAIPQTNGRRTLRIVLSPAVEGRLLRYLASTVYGFQIYGFRARVTPIGVYVDGSLSEVWDTRPIPLVA